MSDQGLHKAEVDNKEIHAIWEHEEPDDGVPIVLVTGASGFVVTHLVKDAIKTVSFMMICTLFSFFDHFVYMTLYIIHVCINLCS